MALAATRRRLYIVPGAPARLVDRYRSRKSFPGRELLGRLLTAQALEGTWRYLRQLERADSDWDRLWTAIAHAKMKSNDAARRHLPRSTERDAYRKAASTARSLAQQIQEALPSLDAPAYRLFPEDVLVALHVRDLNDRPPLERGAAASRLLADWPTATELLEGLAKLAEQQARAAMTRPRPDEHANRGDVTVRVFVWELAQDFQRRHGLALKGTVANIAQVVFENDTAINKDFVRDVLRRSSKGGGR